jgi:hypothetical protein
MTEFERQFISDLKGLGLRRKDVAHKLGITYPSLKCKVNDPNRFKVCEVIELKRIGFTLNHLGI